MSRSRARSASPAPTHRAISPRVKSGEGVSAMSEMLMPARPSVSATSAITPGRLGTAARSSVHRAAEHAGLEQRLALARRRLLPVRQAVAVAGRERVARLLEAAQDVVDGVEQRVAVGQVDVGPQRRVGARHARRVAERRAGRRQPLAAERAAGLADERVGDDVGQVRDGGHHAVVGVGVDGQRPRAEAGDQAVQALEHDPRGRRGRRQVPDRARRRGRRARGRRPPPRCPPAGGRRRSARRRWRRPRRASSSPRR